MEVIPRAYPDDALVMMTEKPPDTEGGRRLGSERKLNLEQILERLTDDFRIELVRHAQERFDTTATYYNAIFPGTVLNPKQRDYRRTRDNFSLDIARLLSGRGRQEIHYESQHDTLEANDVAASIGSAVDAITFWKHRQYSFGESVPPPLLKLAIDWASWLLAYRKIGGLISHEEPSFRKDKTRRTQLIYPPKNPANPILTEDLMPGIINEVMFSSLLTAHGINSGEFAWRPAMPFEDWDYKIDGALIKDGRHIAVQVTNDTTKHKREEFEEKRSGRKFEELGYSDMAFVLIPSGPQAALIQAWTDWQRAGRPFGGPTLFISSSDQDEVLNLVRQSLEPTSAAETQLNFELPPI